MSFVKIVNNLFLGKAEISKIINLLTDDGFKKLFSEETVNYGLIKKSLTGDFTNGRISLGTNPLTIKNNELKAIDSTLNFISKKEEDNIILPNDGNYYWVQAEYKTSPEEEGFVEIDLEGNLTGVNTKFLESLRGKPDNASVIKFTNSSLNNLEYEVVEVIDNNNLILAGDFSAETQLKYKVIGTFDPIAENQLDKDIFQYDSCNLLIRQETTTNQPPASTKGITFNLARVKIDNGQVVIEDKRTEFWETKGTSLLTFLDREENPLIGVESVKFQPANTPRSENLVSISWGFRTENWTINTSLNVVTVNSGQGGIYKGSESFVTGDFDGWRLYTKEGLFSIIKASTKVGNQFNLELDTLDPDRFIDSVQQLIIVPNVDSIEIVATPLSNVANQSVPSVSLKTFRFPINKGSETLSLIVYDNIGSYYNLKYRYKNNSQYTSFNQLKSDLVGYYSESSFTEQGILNPLPEDRVLVPYTTSATLGFIKLALSETSYSNFVNKVDLNDLAGVQEYNNLEALATAGTNRTIPLKVGSVKNNIIITNSSVLTGTVNFDLVEENAKNGSSFRIYIKPKIGIPDLSTAVITIKTGSTTLYSLSRAQILRGEQYFICTFDSTLPNKWSVVPIDSGYTAINVYGKGVEVLNTADNIEVVEGKNILILSGDFNTIQLDNKASLSGIDGFRTINGQYLNDLRIFNTGLLPITFRNNSSPPVITGISYYGLVLNQLNTLATASPYTITLQNSNLVSFVLIDTKNYQPVSYMETPQLIKALQTQTSDILNTNFNKIKILQTSFDFGSGNTSGYEQHPITLTIPNDGILRMWTLHGRGIFTLPLVGGQYQNSVTEARFKIFYTSNSGESVIDYSEIYIQSISAINSRNVVFLAQVTLQPGTVVRFSRLFSRGAPPYGFNMDTKITMMGTPWSLIQA